MTLEPIFKYPVVFFIALLTSFALTPLWIRIAPRTGFLDQPGGRKQHNRAIPVAGGVAVFVAFHLACAAIYLPNWLPFSGQISMDWWLRFLVLSTGIVLLGLLDDRFSFPPSIKLVGQITLAVAAFLFDIRVQNILGTTLPLWMDFSVTLLWFLLMINAFNLIDGIDGLAAGMAVIAAAGVGLSLLFRKAPGDVLLFLGLAGACLGFLRYNFYPARVFLGDTGSMFVGFTLAALSLSTQSKGPVVASLGMPLLAAGIPLFDTVLAVWRRSVRTLLGKTKGREALEHISQGDAEHLHHRLLQEGRSHSQVAVLLYAAAAVTAGVGVLSSVFHDRALGILGLAFLVGAYTVVRHLAWIELHESGQAVLQGLVRPVRRNRTLLLYVVADVLILNMVLLFGLFLLSRVFPSGPDWLLKEEWLKQAPTHVGLPFLMLVLFRSYSRVWYLARVSEYIITGFAVLLGYALTLGLYLASSGMSANGPDHILRILLLAGMSAPLIVGVRAFPRVVQDFMQGVHKDLFPKKENGVPALVCGAGYKTTLFLRQINLKPGEEPSVHIVGLVSPDAAVRGHSVHGIPVLGDYQDLPLLVLNYNVQRVYLVDEFSAEQEKEVKQMIADSPAQLIRWSLREEDIG